MADTPQAESQAEQTSKQTESLPSKALYMDWETASFLTQDKTKRLFAAIPTKRDRALSSPPTATAMGSGPRLTLTLFLSAVLLRAGARCGKVGH